ncbi:MAG: hypothetical protein GW859_10035 [Sphingomonadales bacterium]|nr:hypothetical protein [Sphingomonadales bacterium]
MVAANAASEPAPIVDGRDDPVAVATGAPLPDDRLRWRQVIVEQRVIIRIPARSRASSFRPASPSANGDAPSPTIVWREKKAPRCLPIQSLRGVQVTRDDSIDLLTSERQRLRARLDESCRTLDFYSGFYIDRNEDGMICAGRDVIQARSGARCAIEKFRLMVPVAIRD